MNFITPKNANKEKVTWTINHKVARLVEHYAEYTGYSTDEVVSEFLENLLHDEEFKSHIKSKRNNKRILKDLELKEDDL
ncbi:MULTISPECIES: hypothetical protein [Bhargavaea]|uniref:CopG family transcriptional regulator n=1 Tax=Bhargavaea changchunensis TaxID=2134037 RepID=A0ABW2NH89_9BACL|nr:hypothetical protein [Bhargavaea sp. CC-171006]